MNLLIDTQVLIWFLNEDNQLGNVTKGMIENSDNRVFVSYFSLFEITLKASLGKLQVDSGYIEGLAKIGIDILYPKTDELVGYKIFSAKNKDPFDNMLIATAISENCDFVTSDQDILAVRANGFTVFDARS
jgi:PIN domain nuclease of toxin-antitoxin system